MARRIDTSYMEAHARTRGFMLGRPVKPRPTPDGRAVLFLRARPRSPQMSLFELDVASGRTRELATPAALLAGGSAELAHGLAEFVAQEEMGRMHGYWWSPDARLLAYEQADLTGVDTWWVADPARPGQSPHAQRYPRPGGRNAAVRLGIVPVE